MVRKIAAAVALVDGYTGKRLTGAEARVIVAGGPRPVRKDDGWFVIWDNGLPRRRIVAESPCFETRLLDLDVADIWRKRQPSVRVWMIPGPCYPYPPGIRWRTEQAGPGVLVTGILEGSSGLIKLATDYDPGGETPLVVRFKCGSELEPEGMPLVIRDRESENWELFSIWETADRMEGLGILERPLSKTYRMKDAEICLLWQTVAGADGSCRLPEFCTRWNQT